MLRLYQSLAAWGTAGFESVLKQEIAGQAEHLPLQQALSSSSSVADAPLTVLILSVAELESIIRVKAGVFYSGAMGGCACENDPTPESETTEFCQLQLDMDKASAETSVTILPD